MAEESIGNLIPTKIPTLGTDADIQTALRMYHYGTESYALNSTANTNPASLPTQGIAKYIYDLRADVDSLEAASGIPEGTINAKGDLLVGVVNDEVGILSRGTNGFVLTVDTSATNYLAWKEVEVRADNSVPLSNKTLVSPKVTGSIFDSTNNELITLSSTSSAVNEITVTNAATGTAPSIASTGDNTDIDLLLVAKGTGVVKADGIEVVTISGSQTLTNKTISSITTNSQTLNFPAITGTDTLASLNLAQTIFNKTFDDSTTLFIDSGDSSAKVALLVNDTTASTINVTLPATAGTLALNNQTFFLGTTSVAINRSSGSLTLNGVSIDGNAATATSATSATTATNIAGGAANRIAYNTGSGTTGFIVAPGSANYLYWNGSSFTWATPSTGTSGVTSVGGTLPISSSGGTTPVISIRAASTTQTGAVQLSDSVSSTSTSLAATANAVKTAYDAASAVDSRFSSASTLSGTTGWISQGGGQAKLIALTWGRTLSAEPIVTTNPVTTATDTVYTSVEPGSYTVSGVVVRLWRPSVVDTRVMAIGVVS
jgi:hypothetical protein